MSSDNVFARNQTEVLDAMGAGTGMFVVGTESQLSLDLDSVVAGRFTLGNQADEFGLEATYMTTDQWVTEGTVSDVGGMLASPFSAVGSAVKPLLDNNTVVSVRYATDLKSLQLSLTQLIHSDFNGEANLFYGIRALEIDEDFTYSATNAGGTNTLSSLRDNRLIGPQLGVRSWTPIPGGYLSMSLSGVLAYNDITGTDVAVGPGFAGGGFTDALCRNEASLIGQLGIEYLFQATPNVALRVGYELLGITNVGLATNSPQFASRFTEDVVYSQPYVGVLLVRYRCRWKHACFGSRRLSVRLRGARLKIGSRGLVAHTRLITELR
ncbi:MAG: hypothetical protein H8E66_23360 [Planctomycetes bacterium]|nr:hypothetical protein [Planctomycetota bacterium]